MLQADRQAQILELIKTQKSVRTNELSELFNTSRQTVYNDIEQLDKLGKLIKVHGGAIEAKTGSEPEIAVRKDLYTEDKKKIAAYAATQIEDGDSIFMDIGTTIAHMTEYMEKIKNLTVITNSLEVAYQLGKHSDVEIILLGGMVRNKELAISGPDAINMVSNYYVDKCFIGVGGVSLEVGYTDYILEEAHVRRVMIKNAKKVYSLLDNSKINKVAISKYANFDEIQHIISNHIESQDFLEGIKENNIIHTDITQL